MKILFLGDSPTIQTGFGIVSKCIVGALIKDHDVDVVGVNWKGGYYDNKEFPYRIFPAPYDKGRFPFRAFFDAFKEGDYDVVITFNDIGVLNSLSVPFEKIRKKKKFHWVNYAPVDTDTMHKGHLEGFLKADTVVTYTKFAEETIHKYYPEAKIEIIGHGVDSETFKELGPKKRKQLRDSYFHIKNNTFLVMNINRNNWRKDMYRTMTAFNKFYDKHRSSLLYIHAMPKDTMGGDLFLLSKVAGLKKGNVLFPTEDFKPANVSRREVNSLMNCADVLVSSSTGEGWGMTMTEAMSAKVPIIMPRNTSHIEIIGENEERGYLVEQDGFTIPYGWSVFPRTVCNVDSFVDKLNLVFNDWKLGGGETKEKVDNAYEFIKDKTWDKIEDKWIKLINSINA